MSLRVDSDKMSTEDIRRAKIRLSDEDVKRVKKFQKKRGFSRDRAYGELIKIGLQTVEELPELEE